MLWSGLRKPSTQTEPSMVPSVEAHRIAALVEGGMSVEDVLRDYPNLTAAQVEFALAYAKVNPKHGRPYPAHTVKAALRKGRGGLGRAFAAAREV